MRIIEKSTTFIAVLLVAILFSAQTVFAANMKSYDISELGLSISVPSNMTVYTRTICESKQLLVDKGYSYDSLLSHFETNNIYFNAMRLRLKTLSHLLNLKTKIMIVTVMILPFVNTVVRSLLMVRYSAISVEQKSIILYSTNILQSGHLCDIIT